MSQFVIILCSPYRNDEIDHVIGPFNTYEFAVIERDRMIADGLNEDALMQVHDNNKAKYATCTGIMELKPPGTSGVYEKFTVGEDWSRDEEV